MVILGGIGAEFLTILFLWREHSKPLLVAWFLALLVFCVGRYLTLRRFNSVKLSAKNYQYWSRLNLCWATAWGIHWGILPVFIMQPEMSIYTMCVVIVYTGFTASSVSSSASHYPTFLAFSFPATLMLVGRFLYEGGLFYIVLAAMICFYYAINTILARSSERLFKSARALNFKNLKLMKELEIKKEAAESATRSKDRFLAAASHDLRQPLHASGLLLSALEDYVTHSKGKALLEDIHENNQALNQSFISLLDLSRLDAGAIKVNKGHFLLDRVVQRTIKRVLPAANEKQLEVRNEVANIVIYSDPIIVEQILYNLVANAVEYTQRGRVTVQAQSSLDGRICLRVNDTGIGIDNSKFDEIFSEYYQISNPERDRKKGFGLGLAIVSRLTNILGSIIYLASEQNVGTTFALYFEAGGADQVPSIEDDQNRSVQHNDDAFVLVIDDNEAVLKSMSALLESWGWRVVCAESSQAAIEELGEIDQPPDIIVADFRLREQETGDDAIEAVREEFNVEIPAIIITGDTSKNRLLKLTTVGHKVLHKPVAPELLRATIVKALTE